MVVVVEDAHAPLAAVAMRPEVVVPDLQEVEVARGRGQAFRDGAQRKPGLAEVKGGTQVGPQHIEVTIGIAVVAGHLAHEEEMRLAEVGGKLLD